MTEIIPWPDKVSEIMWHSHLEMSRNVFHDLHDFFGLTREPTIKVGFRHWEFRLTTYTEVLHKLTTSQTSYLDPSANFVLTITEDVIYSEKF